MKQYFQNVPIRCVTELEIVNKKTQMSDIWTFDEIINSSKVPQEQTNLDEKEVLVENIEEGGVE